MRLPAFPLFTRLPLLGLCGLVAPAVVYAQSSAVPVVAIETKREIVTETLPLTGTVTARQQASLSPRISGLVAAVAVDAGSFVEAGDALLTLDPALASLDVEAAEADRLEAEARLTESKRLMEESRRLLARNSVPETQFQNREAAVAMASAAARRAEVQHRESLELLKRHTVVAPFSGVITRKLTEAGEWVSTGAPVLRLVGLQGSRIDVQVPQERIASLTADTPVTFTLDTAPDEIISGRITARVPVSNPDTRSALVRVEPEDATLLMPPGKSARVTFGLRSTHPVLTVPRDALIRRADGTVTVWIAQPKGDGFAAQASRVDLGRTFSEKIEITSGLEEGDRVIIRGNETLQPNQPVRLVDQ
ncbi:MAG: efflux RND transporter periplasmic adaptor subunit [Synoicihabitans sp.]